MFVKPGTGPSSDDPAKLVVLKVRDPVTKRLLPEDGAEVPDTSFWRRMVRDKDVVPAKPPIDETPAAETAPAAAAAAAPASGEPTAHPAEGS